MRMRAQTPKKKRMGGGYGGVGGRTSALGLQSEGIQRAPSVSSQAHEYKNTIKKPKKNQREEKREWDERCEDVATKTARCSCCSLGKMDTISLYSHSADCLVHSHFFFLLFCSLSMRGGPLSLLSPICDPLLPSVSIFSLRSLPVAHSAGVGVWGGKTPLSSRCRRLSYLSSSRIFYFFVCLFVFSVCGSSICCCDFFPLKPALFFFFFFAFSLFSCCWCGGGEEEEERRRWELAAWIAEWKRRRQGRCSASLSLSASLCLRFVNAYLPPSLLPSFPPSSHPPSLLLSVITSKSQSPNWLLHTHTHTHTHTCSEVTHTTCTLFLFIFFINILATAISIQRWSFGSDWWGERRKKHVKKRRCVKVCETECVFSSAATELKDYFNIFLFFIFIFFRGGMLAFFCESEMRKWTSASCRVCVYSWIEGVVSLA